jgi:branched-chain amino acid transport system substrate-binding protein
MAVAICCGFGLAACGGDDDDGGNAGAAATTTAAAPASTGASTTAATGQIDPSKPPVRFAFIAMKIPGLNLYDSYFAGADAAVKALNAKGGFGGRRIILDTCNGMAQPATATTCAHKTLANKPIAEFGCDVAWAASGLEIYAKAKIPSFNCTGNAKVDTTNPWSFAITPAGAGERGGTAKWLCTKPEVKKIAVLSVDVPTQRASLPAQMNPIIDGCGKSLSITYVPLTAADYAPFVQKITATKPDFIVLQLPGATQFVQAYQALKQYGFPADQTIMSSSAFGYEQTLKKGGASMEGIYCMFGLASPDDTSRADVRDYQAAMKQYSNWDYRDTSPETGYQSVLYFYAAAQKIGFDKFDAQTLADFSNNNSGLEMPVSRQLINPGPKGAPQIKQPYVQIVQWKDGKINVVREGTDDGWINAFS